MNISFRISRILMIAYISISTCPLIAMEASSIEVTIPAEFHMMFSKEGKIPKRNLTITGRGDEIIETAVTRSLKENKIKCGDFDTDPVEKEKTLAQARDVLDKLAPGRKLTIQCWSRKKEKKISKEKEKEEKLNKDKDKDIIVQVNLRGERSTGFSLPIITPSEADKPLESALKEYFQERHINCTIDAIKRIKIGQKKVWRKERFLKKSLRNVKKEIGKEIITIECVPTEG